MTKLAANCACEDHTPVGRAAVIANLLEGEAKYSKWEGKDVIIVPIIMARSDVPMNNALVPIEELHAASWNGVPVTLSHPNSNGDFLSANTPENRTDWSVGTIFNAKVVSGQLRGEAWIEVERANKLAPGLIDDLVAGTNMDVSTGYFCTEEEEAGERGGKTYSKVHRALKPDHLALLPNEQGACSWADGCGVRSNKRSTMSKIKDVLSSLKTNAAALITAADQLSEENQVTKKVANADELKKLGYSDEQITAMCAAANADPATNADPVEEEDPDKEKEKAMKGKKNTDQAPVAILSNEDREALAYARRVQEQARANNVKRIMANTTLSENTLKAMSNSQLEAMAAEIKDDTAVANYQGRPMPAIQNGDSDKVKVEPVGVVHAIRERNKAKGAA